MRLEIFHLVLITLILSVNINSIKCGCINSYTTICDSVFDVTKYGRKQWMSLKIQSDPCAHGSTSRETLQANVLERCPNLEELYIIDRLDAIDIKAFQMLEELTYLNIYKNYLQVIPAGMFSNLQNLYKLELEQNSIERIALKVFDNLPKIKTINLSNNKISTVEEYVFDIKGLKKLILSGNIISIIKENSFPSSLEYLDLDNNRIRQVEDQAFSNLLRLKELTLSRNKLKKLRGEMFLGLDNIFKLDVSHNAIDTIEVRAFDDLSGMKLLQLAHNELKTIKPDIFPKNNAMTLQSIRLDHNKLSFLSSVIFDRLSSLRRISIGGNPWQCVCLHEIQLEMNNRNVNYTPCDYQHYFTGKNPTCLQFKTDKCVESVELVGAEFPQLYKEALQNFSYDCP